MLTLPSYIVLFVPLVILVVSGWFCHKSLSPGFNAIIFLAVAFGSALLYIRVTGPLIGGQIISIMIIVAYSAALMAIWPVKDMYMWLVGRVTSPFAGLSSFTISIQRAPAEPRQKLRQWQPSPPTPLPAMPRDDETAFHRERTSPIPVMTPQPSSRPLTLTPPPYQQQERMQQP